MSKHNKITILLGLMIALVLASVPAVWAQDPTIPTRTPTPDPNRPDPGKPPTSEPTPNPGNPPTTEPDVQPTEPPPPGSGSSPEILPTVTMSASATSSSQSVPAITGICDETPYVKAIKATIVYAGPGYDYDEIVELGAEDMRPIIGRALYAQWWQIQYNHETVGWVADAEVNEFGNTALVPQVAAPEINGNTPTPGATWNPTPPPLLTCVPTPTPTPSPTATIVAAVEASPVAGGNVTGGEDSNGDIQSEPQTTPAPGIVSAEIEDSAPVTGIGNGPAGPGVSSRNSDVSRVASPARTMNLLLPLAGLVLISGGIILALGSRKQSGEKTGETDTAKPDK